MRIPEYPNFKNITFEDLDLIAQILKKSAQSICELNLTNLLIWEDFDKPQITLINRNPCVLVNAPNEAPFFLEPFGNNKLIETVDLCLAKTGRLSRITEQFIKQLPADKYNLV